MIGSDTFIIVALRCSESSSPVALASAICAEKNACSSRRLITDADTRSAASTGIDALSTVVLPCASVCSMRSAPAVSIAAAFSLP